MKWSLEEASGKGEASDEEGRDNDRERKKTVTRREERQ
jgi:hypothetical protein